MGTLTLSATGWLLSPLTSCSLSGLTPLHGGQGSRWDELIPAQPGAHTCPLLNTGSLSWCSPTHFPVSLVDDLTQEKKKKTIRKGVCVTQSSSSELCWVGQQCWEAKTTHTHKKTHKYCTYYSLLVFYFSILKSVKDKTSFISNKTIYLDKLYFLWWSYYLCCCVVYYKSGYFRLLFTCTSALVWAYSVCLVHRKWKCNNNKIININNVIINKNIS